MSRRRKGPEGSEHLKGHIKSEVNKLMENRHRLLAPFPYEPAEVHGQLFDMSEWDAIQRLQQRRELINVGDWFYIDGVKVLTADGTVGVKKVTIRCNDLPMPGDNTLALGLLPAEMKENIANWGMKWYQLKRETNSVITKLDQLARHCNTYGQIVRVWPELAGFMGQHARFTIDNARVKSRLPEGVMDMQFDKESWTKTYTLNEQWQPKAFEGLNLLIAEALMLPFSEGQHVATVAD